MKKIAVFMSVILVLNLLLFVSVSAEEQNSAMPRLAEPTVVSGYGHVLGLNQYGRVFAAGDNTYGQSLVFNWSDIVGIAAGKYFSAGLRRDGTVVVAGKYQSGSDFFEFDVSGLERIEQISAGDNFLAALDEDGKVFVVGNDNEGKINTENWENIKKIACGIDHVVGIRGDGSCVGAGGGGETRLDEFNDITDIYAGAHLTVLKDSTGTYYHAGAAVEVEGYEGNYDEYWNSRDWTDVNDIIIFPDLRENGIVIAIKNDGSIVADDNDLINKEDFWNEENGQDKIKLKTIAIKRDNTNLYAICLSADNDISSIGKLALDEDENGEFRGQLAQFDLEMEPLGEVYIKEPQVVVANNTVAFVLPDGKVKSIGEKDLSQFAGIKQLSADMGFEEDDIFIGADNEGNTISNLNNAQWIEKWKGVLKVAPTVCNTKQNMAVALRWDKRMLFYYKSAIEEEYVMEKKNVVDVVCGNYFIAYLTDAGEVEVKEIKKPNGRNNFETTKMNNIERIFGGHDHIVGLKSDGTCVATGGTIIGGECDVSGWSDIIDITAGYGFTVGLKDDGMCEFTGWNSKDQNKLKNAILKTDEEDTEYWENIAQIYSSKNTIVAHKKDGFFEYATTAKGADFSQLENTYFKDDVFYTYKTDGNIVTIEYYSEKELEVDIECFDSTGNLVELKKISLPPSDTLTTCDYYGDDEFYIYISEGNNAIIEYCSDREIDVYISYFDAAGNPVEFKKDTLPPAPSLKRIEYEGGEKAESCMVSIGEPTADKIKVYMEHEADGDTVKISHCALEGQRIMLAFYDNDGNMLDIKVRTLKESKVMNGEGESFSSTGATKYKLFICNGGFPLYLGEGDLN